MIEEKIKNIEINRLTKGLSIDKRREVESLYDAVDNQSGEFYKSLFKVRVIMRAALILTITLYTVLYGMAFYIIWNVKSVSYPQLTLILISILLIVHLRWLINIITNFNNDKWYKHWHVFKRTRDLMNRNEQHPLAPLNFAPPLLIPIWPVWIIHLTLFVAILISYLRHIA
jgi:hypothetical protein